MGAIPTVRIVSGSVDGYTVINESDFDPDVHQLYEVGDSSSSSSPGSKEDADASEADPSPAPEAPRHRGPGRPRKG
jgi:hypothetical protein